jgi:hypothetical protein
MNTSPSDPKDYIQQVLELYRHTPGTVGRIGRADHRLAAEFHLCGIPLATIEAAFVLAASRRCFRAPDAPPLAPIRSMHYFIPVIDEVMTNPLAADYVAYLKSKLKSWPASAGHSTPLKPA